MKKLEGIFKQVRKVANRKILSSRIKFALVDILDLRQRSWKPRMEKKGPKTINEVHKEAEEEKQKIEQQKHSQNDRGGRRGGGRNGQGGQQQFKAIARRPEKVDASRFAGGGKVLGKDMLGGSLGLSSQTKLGANLGRGGRKKGGNSFGALAPQKGASGSASSGLGSLGGQLSSMGGGGLGKRAGAGVGAGAGGTPSLGAQLGGKLGGEKPSLLMKKKQLAAKEQSQSQTPAPSQGRPQQQAPPQANRLAPSSNAPPQAAPAPYQQPAPCRLSKEELYKKTNGCIKEYLSIQDMKEVQAGLREWNHIEATTIFIDQLIMVGVETSRQGQALIQRLLFQLIGRPDGLPSDVFCARMDILFGQLADLRHDIPTLHTSLGEFIAAASAADANVVKVVTNLCHPALIACLGTLGCELTVHVFSTTKVKSPATVMPLYRVLGLDLALLLPESRRADGTLEDICTRAGVPELLQERFR